MKKFQSYILVSKLKKYITVIDIISKLRCINIIKRHLIYLKYFIIEFIYQKYNNFSFNVAIL